MNKKEKKNPARSHNIVSDRFQKAKLHNTADGVASVSNGSIIWVSEIDGKGYYHRLRTPVAVKFERQGPLTWYASSEELLIYGTGRTPRKAFEDLSASLELLILTDMEYPENELMHGIVRTYVG